MKKIQRIIGIIAIVAGVAMLFVSNNIKTQVAEGNLKISSAESNVKSANSLFSLSPATKPIGDQVNKQAQKKISAGKDEIAYYTKLASQLQTGGYIAIVIGAALLALSFWKKRR